MQQKMPEMSDIIQKGIEKLETYRERTRLSKAYILAMGTLVLTIAPPLNVDIFQP